MTSPRFRSGFEKTVWDDALGRGYKLSYETLRVKYTTEGVYSPDFILHNGIIVEAKGYFDPKARSKMIHVKKCNPELDIRFLFMNSKTKINKNSDTTYADWCKRYDFLFADVSIPEKWLKERKKKKVKPASE